MGTEHLIEATECDSDDRCVALSQLSIMLMPHSLVSVVPLRATLEQDESLMPQSTNFVFVSVVVPACDIGVVEETWGRGYGNWELSKVRQSEALDRHYAVRRCVRGGV
jgi:hypothetical protein